MKESQGSLTPHMTPQMTPHSLLMCACQAGAPRCIQHLVDTYPDCINHYMDGDTPLLAAVPWGERFVCLLDYQAVLLSL